MRVLLSLCIAALIGISVEAFSISSSLATRGRVIIYNDGCESSSSSSCLKLFRHKAQSGSNLDFYLGEDVINNVAQDQDELDENENRPRAAAVATAAADSDIEIEILDTDADAPVEASTKGRRGNRVETLRFGGKLSYTSQPFPIPSNITALKDFFTSPDNQHVLLSGAGADVDTSESSSSASSSSSSSKTVELIDTSSLTPEFIQLWKNQSKKVGGSEPILSIDKVVRVIPAAIDIFTVKILPESIIGVAYRPREKQNVTISNVHSSSSMDMSMSTYAEQLEILQTIPEYQAVLIDDEPKAEGPSLLVWLFNKIVYGKGERKRSESALLRVYVEPAPALEQVDTKCDEDSETASASASESPIINHPSFVFKAESEMQMRFDFPYFLMRFFPMKKHRAEEICSIAISRALELNLEPAIENFSALYLKYITVNKE